EYDYKLVPGDIIVRIVIHIASFYILAFLASYVVEQEKKTRSLLEEKESAFNQLDLLFSSIIESVDTGVMTLNLEGLIKSFNRAAEEITGFPFAEVRNRRVKDVLPEFETVLTAGKTKNRIEIVIAGKNEKKITLGCSVSPLREKDSRIIGNILIFQDLTEIKKMEQKLEQQKRLALIGEMAAGLAHEMRNPLASITGSIELLKQGLQLEKTEERLMQIILRGRDQLESFIRDFLQLAKPIPLTRGNILIKEIVEDVLENLKLSTDWNNEIKISLAMEEKASAFANREEIRQVVRNLLLNSLQAMKEGGKLSVAVKTRFEDGKEYSEIIIADEGCGIAADILPKVFEPFFTDKDRGTGLGLTIIGRIVEGYGGKIWLESKVKQGTTCRVWLPGAKRENQQN
ncbi:MAG TPA: ATP-binding protein, partial [Smithellaceae bacterium]|nr:ATP-binding protein [Smithellaceae bacterium]